LVFGTPDLLWAATFIAERHRAAQWAGRAAALRKVAVDHADTLIGSKTR